MHKESLEFWHQCWGKVDEDIKKYVDITLPKNKNDDFYKGFSEAIKITMSTLLNVPAISAPNSLMRLLDAFYLRTIIIMEERKALEKFKPNYVN